MTPIHVSIHGPQGSGKSTLARHIKKWDPTPYNAVVTIREHQTSTMPTQITSDGSTASYYELPPFCAELQDLISHRNMNAQVGEIFRACYRYGRSSHSGCLRDAKKILFYAQAEVRRLESTQGEPNELLD